MVNKAVKKKKFHLVQVSTKSHFNVRLVSSMPCHPRSPETPFAVWKRGALVGGPWPCRTHTHTTPRFKLCPTRAPVMHLKDEHTLYFTANSSENRKIKLWPLKFGSLYTKVKTLL